MPQTMTIKGRKYILVPAAEYRKVFARDPAASEPAVPPLPSLNARGNLPAVDAMKASMARGLVRDRAAVKLTQKELAERAGVRVETLNRAESGKVMPDVRTLQKIERALRGAGLKRR
ncbi:MAG TPA: helix-turn-helix transcriptional regulator [Tepidisphaeraceae bacterium]|nr:helix-turn-helix transcriptional regulator [Tepidisphaeraceae bacterium]